MVDITEVLLVPEQTKDILMNELLDDVIQGCRSDRSGIGGGSREGRRRGRKGIETNEARMEGR